MDLRRIVVGVDGSGAARRALAAALTIAEGVGAQVVAVHALGLLDHLQDPADSDEQWRADVRRRVETTWCAPLLAAGGGHRVELRDGPAPDVVLAVAQEESAVLIIVGSRGVGAEPTRALGSTSLRLLEASRIPVLVVPDDGATPPPPGAGALQRRILAGIDPDDPTLGALDPAVAIAATVGAELVCVAAVPDAGTDVRHLQVALADRGLPPAEVEVGDPATVVMAAAERHDADLVAVGTRNGGGPVDLLLGSVARTVAGRGRRPTLVVPTTWSAPVAG
ncbi:MAG TPA: universal stress protein [Acidimicrobiales bacterium]|nr:universal stress protein [Acidimicrobiales bacterium]